MSVFNKHGFFPYLAFLTTIVICISHVAPSGWMGVTRWSLPSLRRYLRTDRNYREP